MNLLCRLLALVMAFWYSVEAKCNWASEDSVECFIKILDFRRNSSSSAMLVPQPGIAEVRSLKIFCSEVFFFESQLRSDHFGSLDKLTDLEVSYCKLRALPPRTFVGLRSLTSLVVHTHNGDWTTLQMEPDYESLVGLDRLQKIDMRLNNLHKVPPGFFCPLKNLQHIDLSYNSIADLSDLGLSHHTDKIEEEFRCSIPVLTLSLNNNGLVTVTPGSLESMHATLKHIDLSHNNVDVIVDSTFKGLNHLESINLSNNRLAAIPPRIFESTPQLRELTLANNTLGTIDISVFSNLSSLQMLNLSGNNLDENWIRQGIFSKLHSLVVLDLSSNHISRLDDGLLDDLTALQVLNLGHNNIHTIATQLFLNSANLHTLVLKHNQMEILQRQTLAGLSSLSALELDHNRLHTLHSGSLKNCTSLANLGLSHNFLTQVPEAVHQMNNLRVLDLGSNLMGVLKRESLQGLPKLQILRLDNNELSRLGEGAFVEVKALLELDLRKNRLTSLDQEAFKDLKSLQVLALSENQIEDVNGLFTNQVSLLKLNLSANNLLWFDYAFIPPSLESLDIHSNEIDSLGNYFALRDNYNLKYLDASVNKISALHVLSFLPGMVEINVSNNTIKKIAPNTFLGKRRLMKVYLERNQLEYLSQSSLMVSLGHNDQPPQFYLAENPLICDCNLQWFHHASKTQLQNSGPTMRSITSMNQLYPEVPDLELMICRAINESNPQKYYWQSLMQLNEEEFLCPYETHCLSLCQCCDFLACDCQMKCPKDCQCFHDQLWSANVVQCSSNHLSDVPSLVPMDVTVLHLSANKLTRLTQTMFLGRTRLKKIHVAHSSVDKIENGTFSGLSYLEVVNLSHNQLKQLLGHEFLGAESLQELFLDQNQLMTIATETFKHLTKLRVLRLDGNLLIEFPVWELSSNQHLNSLTLASNWWSCERKFIKKFCLFIDSLGHSVVKDAKDIVCNTDQYSQNHHPNCYNNSSIYVADSINNVSSQVFPAVAGAMGLCAALFAFVCVFLCLKDSRWRLCLHKKYGIRIELKKFTTTSPNEGQPPMLFDGLILYSSEEQEAVIGEICKNLEPAYKLCLLHRDLAGIYTSEAFKSALAVSQTHIIVLSRSFMATEWLHVQDLILNYKRVVIILLDDLESDAIKEVKKFTKASTKVLKWSSNDFWDKIKYYLPDPPLLPTKEGGAELDISGVWSYNDARSSFSEVKKKLQCTSHLSIADSGTFDCQATPGCNRTRSCGTNAVHQRSHSALVDTNMGTPRGIPAYINHHRSKSVLLSNEANQTPRSTEEKPSYESPMLMQLATISPILLGPVDSSVKNSAPLPVFQAKKMSPATTVVNQSKTGRYHHQKSRSLLCENNVQLLTPALKTLVSSHPRSSSTLDTASAVAKPSGYPSEQPLQKKLSHLSHNRVNHSRSASLLDDTKLRRNCEASDFRPFNSTPQRKLGLSNPQLQLLTVRMPTSHQRSSSTPYEGFVL